jgi:hypothetical protein
MQSSSYIRGLLALSLLTAFASCVCWHALLAQQIAPVMDNEPFPIPQELRDLELLRQSKVVADAKSTGCMSCHQNSHDPHWDGKLDQQQSFYLGCTDCHGGNPNTGIKEQAHVRPRFPEAWPTAANPVRSYTLLNHECPEFIRFVNPGDLRVAHLSCGNCHGKEVLQNHLSMMTHGCMLWGAALYNNGTPFML